MAEPKLTGDLRARVAIEDIRPCVDGGRFAVKRSAGETVSVEADVFTDGHDQICAMLCHRRRGDEDWQEERMSPCGNDRWRAEFRVTELGIYEYTVLAWVDPFLSWRAELEHRIDGDDILIELSVGVDLIDAARSRAPAGDAEHLARFAAGLDGDTDFEARRTLALDSDLERLMVVNADRSLAVRAATKLEVTVDRERALCGAWYEVFPRSFGGFAGCEEVLDYVAEMGFDTIYLPPIHPIGETRRKGPNNALTAQPGDPGSPWAIGGPAGGHKSVHPELGTLDSFRDFVAAAGRRGLEVALDIALQCSPDHPYVREHPDWFRHRPDGSIRYAENPPKKYEDIYPFDFECEDWEALWQELLSVFVFWIEQNVRIFRVDNPHTKPFRFWEWLISEVRERHPDVIFLSEAFTRPKVMHRLAKLGFTQSYTYFTWRNTKPELADYMHELTRTSGQEYFRPNLWPNTPDILNEYLQFGGRPAFLVRLTLAATLSASYGIYGPAFELTETRPLAAGSEEYLDSEKYQLRRWDLEQPWSLSDVVARVNRIRRQNPALHRNRTLRFHPVDNDEILCYSKETAELDNVIVVVANLDPHHRQTGWLTLDLDTFDLDEDDPYQMHDLFTGSTYLWHGPRNFVALDPNVSPVHIFHLRRRLRTERDFAYYF